MIMDYDFNNKVNHAEVSRLVYSWSQHCPTAYKETWLDFNKLEHLLKDCYADNDVSGCDSIQLPPCIVASTLQKIESRRKVHAWDGSRTGVLFLCFTGRNARLHPEELVNEELCTNLKGPSLVFFEELGRQLNSLNAHFEKRLEMCRRSVRTGMISAARRTFSKIALKTKKENHMLSPEDEVFWCLKFAQVNTTAAASLLDRYTSQMAQSPDSGGLLTPSMPSTAHLFLNQTARHENIMSRPLWVELRAIQDQVSMLYGISNHVEREMRSGASVGSSTMCSAAHDLSSPVSCYRNESGAMRFEIGKASSTTPCWVDDLRAHSPHFEEYDLQCAICLDVMYNPVGLDCGHCFCQDCLISSCGGRSRGHKPKELSIHQEPPCCPLCREGFSIDNIVHMPQLDHLIKMRYPTDW
eukprot:CAMPEP_0196582954 /NCGR_PEP_ID=MMETSP1081-20130531/41398_1 /TAXON_ID=36882 /ORGANISM="Pyramimonas amylifera, Strain CCMP720" /LENGTH=410 /DNA_ID=CAMNT_0041903685 /DNA_START=98 /DNA_END=1327 /DNA_ORIENTATION=+